jgi:hypothetical protein
MREIIKSWNCTPQKINELFTNKKIVDIEITDEEITLFFDNEDYFKMFHEQECCENVYIEDINGNKQLKESIFYELIEKKCDKDALDEDDESFTWTFYTIKTSLGYLDIRWYGSSSGYYSENVDLEVGISA